MLTSIVYVSSATHLFSQQELFALLEVSRRNNTARDVSGLLLHIGGNFMQALEGPDNAVDDLYHRIGADPRHNHISTILRVPVAERQFPDWAMGFREIGELPADEQAQVSSFMTDARRQGVSALPQRVAPTLALLRRFAVSMR
jgi:hypothetical protein